jgi:hypothetical protein
MAPDDPPTAPMSNDPASDEDRHIRPTGTMFIMGLYVLALVAAWAWVYFIMAERV